MEKRIAELNEVLTEGPVKNTKRYFKTIRAINGMISTSAKKDVEIAEAVGITISQLYRRKKNPTVWTEEELYKLWKVLGIKE